VFVFETDVIGDSVALFSEKVHRRCSWKWRRGKKLVMGGGLSREVPQQIIREGPAARRACETVCRRRRP
jgi:hypothetical protein